ncbi:MAG TPA: LytTR family DNA-binding domain-containing protein [Pyrinomonadaceae bacterium]|nr:LytTR family DNA-binding domain-containing protein [Pyrinomonadaceae bacterium]
MSEVLSLRALIVDDQRLHRSRIRQLLGSHPEVEVVGECDDGYKAIAAVRELAPDLVFLDIVMPEVNGFDVIEALLPGPLPLIIFVTGHDEFAVRAFEVSAVDYLRKPFDQERFDRALHKAKRTLATEKSGELTERVLALLEKFDRGRGPLEWLVIKSGANDLFIRTEEIAWIDADRKETWIHVGGKTYLSPKKIGVLEAQLDPAKFVRVNRSFIVNIDFVQGTFHRPGENEYKVVLKDGKKLDLSDGGRARIKKLLSDNP